MTTPQGMLADALDSIVKNSFHHNSDHEIMSQAAAALRLSAAPQGREATIEECARFVEKSLAGSLLSNIGKSLAEDLRALTPAVAHGTAGLRDALIAARPHVQEMSLRLPTDSAIDCARTLDQIDAALAQAQEPGEDIPAISAIHNYLAVFDRCGGSESVSAEEFAECRAAMRRAVGSSPPPQVDSGGEWQPIETAPRGDYDFFLVCSVDDDRSPFVVRGSIMERARMLSTPAHLSLHYLTHWMPLPMRPERSGGRGA